MDDLNEVITRLAQAVAVTPIAHPDYRTSLIVFGKAFQRRSEKAGVVHYLNRVIAVFEDVVARNHLRALHCLGSPFHRHRMMLILDDLNRVILIHEKTVASTLDGHPDSPIFLTELGRCLISKD